MNIKLPESIGCALRRINTAVLAVSICLGTGSVGAADSGPRHHAKGAFDAASGAYAVVEGDDLDAIAERFGVTLAELKESNKLGSDKIEAGQNLIVAADAEASDPAITGVLGSPSATTTIDGNRIPGPEPEFGGVIKETLRDRRLGGRRASYHPRVRRISC